MATLATLPVSQREGAGRTARPFALAALLIAALSAFLAGWLPLGFSIVTVFLFAGPHNWLEVRYFLTRLPARWGRLRGYFLTAFTGIFGLTAAFAAIPWLAERLDWEHDTWLLASATWNSVLVLWILALIQMRSRQNPRRDWFWTLPVAFLLMALTWVAPLLWGLALVYLHPLMAFWLLDREIRRSRPEWRTAYQRCLLAVPVLLGFLWWHLADSPSLPGEDALTVRITQHAGASLLPHVSSHLLVATHTFLEMLHYGVWLIAMPLVALRVPPWQLHTIPLARRSRGWYRFVLGLIVMGVLIVLLLWGCFLANYPLTRDVYFTVALLHVLAEVPFLLRTL